MGVNTLPQNDDFSLCFWPARTSVESSSATSVRAVALWVTGVRLSVICFGHCCSEELWQRWTVSFSGNISVSGHELTFSVNVRQREDACAAATANCGRAQCEFWLFLASLGVNHRGSFPLTELPSVKMCPSRSPGVAFPFFLQLPLIRSPFSRLNLPVM